MGGKNWMKEDRLMKRAIGLSFAVSTLLLSVSCSKPNEPAVMNVYHGGNEYRILDRGDTTESGQAAYFVRYWSENPADETIRNAECKDLYAIIAQHIDTNKHQRIVIEAVEEKGRLFGLMKQREVVESKSVETVLNYKSK
jgi:hypothetical protein